MAQTLGFMLYVLGLVLVLVACVLGLESQVLGLGLGFTICVLDSITGANSLCN